MGLSGEEQGSGGSGGSVVVAISRTPEGEGLPLPSPATEHAAGLDLYAAVTDEMIVAPRERKLISTGIRIALPPGYEAQVRPRSGLALRHGISLVNSPGTIDADYRGTVSVILINHGSDPFAVRRGERIAQLVVAPVVSAKWSLQSDLDTTERGDGGFGHTGR